jgi:hypothetical protein
MRSATFFRFTSLLITVVSLHASAGYYSAKGVVANCKAEATYESGWCAGYLGSWADADIDHVRRKACIPRDTSLGTLKKVLLDYAVEQPSEVESMSGGEFLQRAFSRKWPTISTDDTQSEIYRHTC